MNENSKTEIDELLTACLDDALTQRQQTELKRLLQHHPEMTEQLRMMERQRQLLCSLPIETAPSTLIDDVKARLERNLILEDAVRMQRAQPGDADPASFYGRRGDAVFAAFAVRLCCLSDCHTGGGLSFGTCRPPRTF